MSSPPLSLRHPGAAIAAAVAAGGTVVDDSDSPGLTVIADQDGNRGFVCADSSAAAST